MKFINEDQVELRKNSANIITVYELGKEIDLLTKLVYEYVSLDSALYDTDDEIINWTFPDVNYDFISAIYNLYSALYKTSASSLRNAFEMSFLALYFQMRQNNYKNAGQAGYNNFFEEWDRGDRKTPNWGEMKTIVDQNAHILNYNATNGCNIVEEVYSWYSYLCNFTHGKPFDNSISLPASLPTNHMNIGTIFNQENFERFSNYIFETITWIAVFWSISFPEILKDPNSEKYKSLFRGSRAVSILSYIKARS